ncbi:MAG: heme biosynthesis protein HemY [Azonexus sp.]|nr:heme biosynthesis protein HemY [Azonexus sp.]
MKGLFWVLGLFALATALALGARLNEGYVLVVLPPWRLEISLNLLIFGTLAAFVVFYMVFRSLMLMFGLPGRVAAYKARHAQQRGERVFQDAVRLLFEGRFGQALKRATEAYTAGAAPGLSALIAARAAQRMRESEKQQGWLDAAKRADPRNEASALMLEAEMMNEAGRYDEALAALAHLQDKRGRHIAALRVELRARQGAGDWDGVLKLLRQLAKRDALPEEMVRQLGIKAHLANIADRADDAGALQAYLKTLPDSEQDSRVVLAAARALTAVGAMKSAQQLIETTLDAGEARWDSRLLVIYGRLTGGDQTARIARADAWLQHHPDDDALLMALGRMCFRQRLWGKAQSYLEASLAVRPTQEAHLELAALCDQLERTDEANRHYRAAVALPLSSQ